MDHCHRNDYAQRFWVALAVTVPILLLSPISGALTFTGDKWVLLVVSTFLFYYGGYPFLDGMRGELKERNPGMMTLIALAISVAYLYSAAIVFGLKGKLFFWELATLIDIMLLGHWIEMRSVMGAGKALESLARLLPAIAHKVVDGAQVDVPLNEIGKGDQVLVRPGEKIPADGTVLSGSSHLNESMLTGESKMVHRSEGQEVIGGSINGEGALDVQVNRTGADSFLSQMIALVKEAQASKSKTQDLANRAAYWLTIAALAAGTVTFILWIALSDQSVAFALERTVSVMVITCPHALGLAVPLVVSVSTSLAASHGFLIRNRQAFEAARNIDVVLFDKTGTLTKGEFGVVAVESTISREEALQLAAAVESRSEHPIARAIVAASGSFPAVEEFQALPGEGIEGTVEGKHVAVVSRGFLERKGLSVAAVDPAYSTVHLLVDGVPSATISLSDVVRPESRAAIDSLHAQGIECWMLTGDQAQVANQVAMDIGIDNVLAEVLPAEKRETVRKIQESGRTVAMIGDGVNDAPALAQADIGIAIGAGTDVAIETADIILVRSDPRDVTHLVQLARSTYRKIVQNLIWATGYNAIAIPLAAGILYPYGILLSPAVSAVLMSFSTIICAANARLLRLN